MGYQQQILTWIILQQQINLKKSYSAYESSLGSVEMEISLVLFDYQPFIINFGTLFAEEETALAINLSRIKFIAEMRDTPSY